MEDNASGNRNKNLVYCHCNLTDIKGSMEEFHVKNIPSFNFYHKEKLFKQTQHDQKEYRKVKNELYELCQPGSHITMKWKSKITSNVGKTPFTAVTNLKAMQGAVTKIVEESGNKPNLVKWMEGFNLA